MKIQITAGQAVSIHGWIRARRNLTWGDILADENMMFQGLLGYNLTETQLHMLQPELEAWIKAGRAKLMDCPRLSSLWGAHPIKDFRADLADMVNMKWGSDVLMKMGVTYQDLLSLGITPETMNLFGFTLMMWSTLGFGRMDAERIPAPILFRLFNMTKQDVLACLRP